MRTADTQVAVVGAGPVGLLLAGELRLGGAEVLVLERLAEPTTESRASTVHARTMEILAQRGLLDALGDVPSTSRGHFGGLPLDFDDLPTAYPGQWKLAQARLEELLGKWATGLGATVLREHEVRGLAQRADGVELEVACPGGPLRVRAGYVVGCDGEDSTVREAASFDFAGSDATRVLLRGDVTGVEIRDRRFERHPGGLAVAGTLPSGVTRVMVHETGLSGYRGEPGFAELAAAWARVTGEDISGGTPLWVNAFGDGRRQASEYRRGRVLLAGDAAHLLMPAGGQALNLGLHDAMNLGWKLAACLRGDAPAGLLDSYHAERHPVADRALASVGAQALLLLGGPEVDPVREVLGEVLAVPEARRHLAGRISGVDVRYDLGGDHPLVGARLRPDALAELPHDGRGVLLDSTPDGLVDATAPWADRVHAMRGNAFESGSAVLARPDGHVTWLGRDERGLRSALSRWFGQPR